MTGVQTCALPICHTQRFTQCWWALDSDLAHQRHYPAIDWLTSYSLYLDQVAGWWSEEVDENWKEFRHQAMEILRKESSLQQLVQLVGADALSNEQQWVLTGARMLREGFLQQNALHETDAYAVPEKQVSLLHLILRVYEKGRKLLNKGTDLDQIHDSFNMVEIIRLREQVENEKLKKIEDTMNKILEEMDKSVDG